MHRVAHDITSRKQGEIRPDVAAPSKDDRTLAHASAPVVVAQRLREITGRITRVTRNPIGGMR